MKYLIFILISAFLLSCREDEKEVIHDSIAGDWEFTGVWYIHDDSYFPKDSTDTITKNYSIKILDEHYTLEIGNDEEKYIYQKVLESEYPGLKYWNFLYNENRDKLFYNLFDLEDYFIPRHFDYENVFFSTNFLMDSSTFNFMDLELHYTVSTIDTLLVGKNMYNFKGSAVRILK